VMRKCIDGKQKQKRKESAEGNDQTGKAKPISDRGPS
jgi:hypothetical protein